MAESDGKRPRSFIDDETIEIKPSTELIPDEYERVNNANVLVELICRQSDEEADDLAKNLTNLGFLVNKIYTDKLNINENWISEFVSGVNKKTQEKQYDGLLMIFAKIDLKNAVLKKIWGNFTSAKCPALKNKPKIFIFQIFKSGPVADSAKILLQIDVKTAYDTPAEADILIIYDKYSSESSNDFLENFHQHIKDYAHREDIINLVSLSVGSEFRPLIISTMTRKFFFVVTNYRGHHHNINESHTEIKEGLEKIMDFIKSMPDHKPKEKEKSLMSSIRKTFSFKNKNQHGNESKNDKNKVDGSERSQKLAEVREEKRVGESSKSKPAAGVSKEKSKPSKLPGDSLMPPPSTSPPRKSSVPNTPVRKTTPRTKYPSETFSSKEDLSKKPPWK